MVPGLVFKTSGPSAAWSKAFAAGSRLDQSLRQGQAGRLEVLAVREIREGGPGGFQFLAVFRSGLAEPAGFSDELSSPVVWPTQTKWLKSGWVRLFSWCRIPSTVVDGNSIHEYRLNKAHSHLMWSFRAEIAHERGGGWWSLELWSLSVPLSSIAVFSWVSWLVADHQGTAAAC